MVPEVGAAFQICDRSGLGGWQAHAKGAQYPAAWELSVISALQDDGGRTRRSCLISSRGADSWAWRGLDLVMPFGGPLPSGRKLAVHPAPPGALASLQPGPARVPPFRDCFSFALTNAALRDDA